MRKSAILTSFFCAFVLATPTAFAADDVAAVTASPSLVLVGTIILAAIIVFVPMLVLLFKGSREATVHPRGSGAFDAVIALVGHKAAGKDEFCRILTEKGFATRRISDAIRAEAKRRGIDDPSVFVLQTMGNEGRQKGGSGFWASELIADLEKDGVRLAVVNGVRNPGELDALQGSAGDAFIAVGITAPYEVRKARFMGRGQAGDTLTDDAFAKMDAIDRGEGQSDDGQQTDRCMAMVWPDNLYVNDGSLEDYRAWVREFLFRHGLGNP